MNRSARWSTGQRLLVAADLLAVAGLLWLGLAVAAAFSGPGTGRPRRLGDLVETMALFGGIPLLLAIAAIMAARVLVRRGRGAAATVVLAVPLLLAALWLELVLA